MGGWAGEGLEFASLISYLLSLGGKACRLHSVLFQGVSKRMRI